MNSSPTPFVAVCAVIGWLTVMTVCGAAALVALDRLYEAVERRRALRRAMRELADEVEAELKKARVNARNWQDQAACLGHHEFFDAATADEHSRAGRARHQAALAICRECPVLWPCRSWALKHYEDDGPVIGGMTGQQRRQWRRLYGIPRPAEVHLHEWIGRAASQ